MFNLCWFHGHCFYRLNQVVNYWYDNYKCRYCDYSCKIYSGTIIGHPMFSDCKRKNCKHDHGLRSKYNKKVQSLSSEAQKEFKEKVRSYFNV